MKASDYRETARQSLKGNWGNAAILTFLIALVTAACGAGATIAVGALVLLAVSGPMALGYSIFSMNLIRNKSAAINDVFDGFKDFGRAFTAFILIEIFTFLWTLLFVIPGIVMRYAYSMTYYILADRPNMSANEARKASIDLMRGNKWRLFCLHLSFIGWYLLVLLTFGILIFWVQPYVKTATTAFYQNLLPKEERAEQTFEDYRLFNGESL